jgi:tRNA threonylcarbamoyl adenosine modification protein YeaZ
VILLIDTSTRNALIGTIGDTLTETYIDSRSPDLIARLRQTARSDHITRVAVAAGPGSFTGLRVGVAFGLGLAMGLHIPIVPLSSFDLQSARSESPVVAVIEAGRGRFYFRPPDGRAGLGAAEEVPHGAPIVGRLTERSREALEAAHHELVPDDRLKSEIYAANTLLETAPEVAYGSLEIEYMQSFSAHP